jgi:hypothetical protein
MAKRMTDTDKWKKPFMKTLPVEYKLFWLYLLDECDHSGIWHMELDLAELRLGIKLSPQKIRGFFKERIVEFDNGTKWFLPDFISFQYGELDMNNRAHKSVVDRLLKYNLPAKIKGVACPLQGAKDKDKDKDKVITGGVGDSGLVFDAREFITDRQKDFEKICMTTRKTAEQATESLTKYHLWMDREGKYPVSKKSALSGFELWLMNDKDAPAVENKYEDQLAKARKNFKPTPQ